VDAATGSRIEDLVGRDPDAVGEGQACWGQRPRISWPVLFSRSLGERGGGFLDGPTTLACHEDGLHCHKREPHGLNLVQSPIRAADTGARSGTLLQEAGFDADVADQRV
jgi:hypothetical protein